MGKTVILLVFGASVYIGMQLERRLAEERCLSAGGAPDARGVCTGVAAP
ncbi:hypothetical protein Dshi_0345 [Dinoroseobacter shibae DFL 12 = DSM 16493]|jgi:hypothetical protein|uniref:Uncharacterized protein n=1 Tax=Dinoroseobacter shibae (strain DSM 16493 / NCIMB 14021 / DFL 12) TaxID=398580 RepID=A8LMB7_DINSH|nr:MULTISPECIES: hypothetical protein [Dinoroseobacter]ABV92094.1 hypothetical protein Dshi_0345 [Dinoroseobacter shibae DFL 12 = DSM 16493]MDD9718888.1 hypothetical protein [Dinoroseobacter sp. PD6]URF47056.1 hypothetical protein M8008_01760 [Dinoroseobacter shibae]URF51367.1 hypothetical protein M8007_01760 [Dinoroseobacter shibae]